MADFDRVDEAGSLLPAQSHSGDSAILWIVLSLKTADGPFVYLSSRLAPCVLVIFSGCSPSVRIQLKLGTTFQTLYAEHALLSAISNPIMPPPTPNRHKNASALDNLNPFMTAVASGLKWPWKWKALHHLTTATIKNPPPVPQSDPALLSHILPRRQHASIRRRPERIEPQTRAHVPTRHARIPDALDVGEHLPRRRRRVLRRAGQEARRTEAAEAEGAEGAVGAGRQGEAGRGAVVRRDLAAGVGEGEGERAGG